MLVLGGGFEELLPKFFGVGFPVLLALVAVVAAYRGAVGALLFAVAAGAVEDALGGLPLFVSVAFFSLTALVVRRAGFPRAAATLASPLYHLWLGIWLSDLNGSVFTRMLMAVPIGFVTACAAGAAFDWASGKAGCDEQG